MQLNEDTRADAIGIARLFFSLVVGAIVFWIVTAATDPMFDHVGQSNDPVANQGTAWLQEATTFLPIMFLLIAFFGMIAYSVYSREVAR